MDERIILQGVDFISDFTSLVQQNTWWPTLLHTKMGKCCAFMLNFKHGQLLKITQVSQTQKPQIVERNNVTKK